MTRVGGLHDEGRDGSIIKVFSECDGRNEIKKQGRRARKGCKVETG